MKKEEDAQDILHEMRKSRWEDTVTGEPYDPTELPLQVCQSNAGYYIGQLEPGGAPYSRLSGYYPDYGDAEKALKHGWLDRQAEENRWLVRELKAKGKIGKEEVN